MSLNIKSILLIITCLLVCMGRFLISGHALSLSGTYEALAHIWVGSVATAWYFDRSVKYLAALGIATLLEVIMFALR